MSSKRLVLLAVLPFLAACSAEEEDLRAWMKQESRGLVGKIAPLPEIKQFPEVAYDQAEKLDPFRAARIRAETRARMGTGPDMSRPREPLESFPLESLKMVGTIMQDERVHALINASGRIHQLAVGNYMGQDHGMVTKITDGEVLVTEIVEDINGDWVERVSQLRLQGR